MIFLNSILFGILVAMMDTLENENFHASIFRNLPKMFWYKRDSKGAKSIFGFKLDGWHITKGVAWALAGTNMVLGATVPEAIGCAVMYWVTFEDSYMLFNKRY